MKVILETPNPYDITLEDLAEVAQGINKGLSDAGSDAHFDVAPVEVYGAGVQFWDLIHVWLPDADFIRGAAYTYAMKELTAFMRKRYSKPKEENRKRIIYIYGPDGTPLKEVEVPREGDPIERDVSAAIDKKRPQRWKRRD